VDHGDRAAGVVNALLADRTEQQFAKAPGSSRADDQQLRSSCGLEQRNRRSDSLDRDGVYFQAATRIAKCLKAKRLDHPFRVPLDGCSPFLANRGHFLIELRNGPPGVNHVHGRPTEPGLIARKAKCSA